VPAVTVRPSISFSSWSVMPALDIRADVDASTTGLVEENEGHRGTGGGISIQRAISQRDSDYHAFGLPLGRVLGSLGGPRFLLPEASCSRSERTPGRLG
jgi:hypothetical protein